MNILHGNIQNYLKLIIKKKNKKHAIAISVFANGEIILLQNPECCHIGDLLIIINIRLKENDYLFFTTIIMNTFVFIQYKINFSLIIGND